MDDSIKAAHNIADLGSEQLLTPERLQRKTAAITGYNWRAYRVVPIDSLGTGLSEDYRLYYGGIDSADVTSRSTELTPLMSTVAMTHALESACPIVLREFILSDGERKLFNVISADVTPDTDSNVIKEKLVELHGKMLGKSYEVDSAEILFSYHLFVDSWQERNDQNLANTLTNNEQTCEWVADINFLDGLGYSDEALVLTVTDFTSFIGFDVENVDPYINSHVGDPNHTKQAWLTVIT